MDLSIGTSGFAYKEWIGTFYPKGLSSSEMLRYYAGHFRAVEINNTFFRMPTEPALQQWAADVPDGFRFAIKAPQLITHRKRLKEVDEPVAGLFRVVGTLGARLGPVLFQLPPNLKKDLPRLETFLELVPAGARAAIEFRHPSWFDEEVFDALRRRAVALCVAHGEGVDAPRVSTAGWGYLRLRQVTYTDAELRDWRDHVRAQEWSEAFVFFKHEDTGTGPTLARRVEELFAGA